MNLIPSTSESAINTEPLLLPASFQDFSGAPGLTVADLLRIVKRRRAIFGITFCSVLLAALLYIVFSARRYQATGEIQIQKDSSDALGIDSLLGSAGSISSDALDANVTLQTEAKVLESQTLALRVINDLHLADTSDFQSHFSVVGWVSGLLQPKQLAESGSAGLEDSPHRRDHAYATFKKNTKVAPVAGTRLIDISYTGTDPKLAAAAVNQLISDLVDYNFQTRYTATAQASDWLAKQLSELRDTSEQLQKRVAGLQRESGVFSFGGDDLGANKGIAYSTVLDQLQQTTATLTQAQANRIIKGAIFQAAQSGDSSAVAQLGSSGLLNGASPVVGNSLALLQTLLSQEATQQAQLSEAASKFGPGYPKLEEMQANLTSVRQSIKDEQSRLKEQARTDYFAAQQVEAHERSIFNDQKKAAEALNDKAIQYQMIRQEADQSRGLYERLLSKLKEAGVLEGLKSSNITIVEPGRVPSSPASPNLKLVLAGALFGGAFLSFCLAIGFDLLDNRIQDVTKLSQRFGDSYFGELPFEREKAQLTQRGAGTQFTPNLYAAVKPGSQYSEALRALRTAILLARSGAPPKILLVTSSSPGEGKSTLAANLATLLAQHGKRVLLVDADLRRPTVHRVFGLGNEAGLSSLLTSDLAQTTVTPFSPLPGLSSLQVIAAGTPPPFPSELLGSAAMADLIERWRRDYDFVIFDSAPALPVTDAVVLAPMADHIILVARHAYTQSTDLDKTYRLLRTRSRGTSVGIVINGLKRHKADYYGDYEYKAHTGREGSALHA